MDIEQRAVRIEHDGADRREGRRLHASSLGVVLSLANRPELALGAYAARLSQGERGRVSSAGTPGIGIQWVMSAASCPLKLAG